MQRHTLPVITLLLFSFLSIQNVFAQAVTADEWLERGRLAAFSGDAGQALEIWNEAVDHLERPDARIGFEIIRLATEQQLEEWYELASIAYMWSLRAEPGGESRAALRQEIERLRPITGERIYHQWREWWEQSQPQLGHDMAGFWIQMEQTPGENIHERLIEHWRRIATARERFVRHHETTYGTDQRAIPWIRFGEPDQIWSGTLTLNFQQAGEWLGRQWSDLNEGEDEDMERTGNQERRRTNPAENLSSFLTPWHTWPEVEVWIYHFSEEEESEPVLFLFGTEPVEKRFQAIRSIGDLIPGESYDIERFGQEQFAEMVRRGLTPAAGLLFIYYEQLSAAHPWFAERARQMRQTFLEQESSTRRSFADVFRMQNFELISQNQSRSPRERSDVDRVMPSIPVQISQYRFLDKENRPQLLTFLDSNPTEAIQNDIEHNQSLFTPEETEPLTPLGPSVFEHYSLRHRLIQFNEQWLPVADIQQNLNVLADSSDSGSWEKPQYSSIFYTLQEVQNFYSASAQIMNTHSESHPAFESTFPPSLRGLGRRHFQQPPPLQSIEDSMEVADLILGYRDSIPDDYPFSFQVANDRTLPVERNLVLHFEVYHLMPDTSSNLTQFELTYRIFPVRDHGEVITDQEAFYLTLNFMSEESRVIEDLEIQTSSLEEGTYELRVVVADQVSGREKERTIRFRVGRTGKAI
ncbi:MAG: hypothetical protein WDZ29_08270 [Balneolaceae bacterium]